ncbi:hypothetical protein CROQUDRAFT_659198, partial [Cronartium quercuum f. sp. fusiforme G11]
MFQTQIHHPYHPTTERTVLLDHKSTTYQPTTHPSSLGTEEKRILRKLDRRILPLTAILYLSAYLDRGNLGNARLQGLQSELLDESDTKFSVVLCSFFITYVILSIPGTLLAKAISPSKTIAIGAIIWASATSLIASCNSYSGLIFLRMMIGVGEALFGQSVALYYSVWYKKGEISTRLAMFIGAGVSAGGFGGLIAYAVSTLGPNNWRMLFLVEGIPSLLVACAILFWLPSRPDKSPFLSSGERAVVLHRLQEDGGYEATEQGIDWSGVRRALTDWKAYVISILFSCLNLTLGSVSGFLPSIVASMGHAGPIAQLYTIPPHIVAFITMTLISIASDRYQTRALPIAGVFTISSIGWIILILTDHNNSLRYFATFLVVIGGVSCIS